jgi:hypothetical protein
MMINVAVGTGVLLGIAVGLGVAVLNGIAVGAISVIPDIGSIVTIVNVVGLLSSGISVITISVSVTIMGLGLGVGTLFWLVNIKIPKPMI